MIRPIEWSLYPRVHIPYLKNGPIVGMYQINGGVGNVKLIVSAIIRPDARLNIDVIEAYSAAGKTWFGWWLVEHYLPYHVDCPNSCGLGEPARGRKDPPYFQMSYGSLDNIADLVDPLVESPLPA